MAKTDFKSVDEYITTLPEDVQAILQRVRSTIRKAVPGAEEVISYQIPAYKLPAGPVLYFAGWEAALLAVSGHGSHGGGVQGRPCTVRGRQGHDPIPAFPARPREVDRAHREVPREGNGDTREGEAGRAEEARCGAAADPGCSADDPKSA
jgi:hypothetical protein